ncbi:tryptophan 2,3-dioxygenase family protein [Actinosynnema sp. NPDC020468]|uniref:tryptophan 2,3-dioxygenase n=1 Tax=Actinosynnema sp. NPDC020468 TaxID=3154488 RepID=UPI0033E13D70
MAFEPVGRARPFEPSSEVDRSERAQRNGGLPQLDFGQGSGAGPSTPFIDYLHLDVLLQLQHPRTGEPAEASFLVLGQIHELLFTTLFSEVDRARDLLLLDRLPDAVHRLHRVERHLRLLEATWEPLSVITPDEFTYFRDQLGVASGVQSFTFRQLEFVLGNKSRRMAEAHRPVPWAYERVDRALRAPSVYDAGLRVLSKHGPTLPPECLDYDYADEYRPQQEVEDAWAEVYREPDRYRSLHVLAEALVDVSFRYTCWHDRHVLTVERLMGSKPGSGGSDGVRWLRSGPRPRYFPELWSARSAL